MTPTDALAAALCDRLLAEQPVPIPGLGTLRRVHLPARVEALPDGARRMLPPGQTVRLDPAPVADGPDVDALAAAFAERIGLGGAAPAAQTTALRTALDAVEARLAVTGEAELPGVGTFGRTSSGIDFAASERLLASVNGRYGGLAPVTAPPPAPPSRPTPHGDTPAPPAAASDTRPFWLDDLDPAPARSPAPGRPALAPPAADDLDALVDDARAAGLAVGTAPAVRSIDEAAEARASAAVVAAARAAHAPPPPLPPEAHAPHFTTPPVALIERVRALPEHPAALRPAARPAPLRAWEPPTPVRTRPSPAWLALPLLLLAAGVAAWLWTRPDASPELAATVAAVPDSVAGGRVAAELSGTAAPLAALAPPTLDLPTTDPPAADPPAEVPAAEVPPAATRPDAPAAAPERVGALRRVARPDPPRAAPPPAGRRLGVAPPRGVAILPPRLANLPDADVDALAGGRVAAGDEAYAWIVLSSPSRAEAEALAERYRTAGYRVGVVEAPGDAAGWRVAVGAFATRAQALRLLDRLPPQAPPDTWLLDLRTLAARG